MTREITVSYSEIQAARRCSLKHNLAWQWGWRKELRPDSALAFGIAWHEVLNAYYDALRGKYEFKNKSGAGFQWRGGWHAGKEVIEDQEESLRERLRWMLEGYAAFYGKEPGWHTLATEEPLVVELPQLFDDLKIHLKVKIDLIVKDRDRKVWVDDHKTCATIPSSKKAIDPQLPLYMYALAQHPRWGELPFGARYSYSRKPSKTFKEWPLEERFRRRLVSHTEKEVMAVARDAYKTIYTRYWEAEHFPRPPRNITPDCSFCDFHDPCVASRKGYNLNRFLKDNGFSHWREEIKTPKEIIEDE